MRTLDLFLGTLGLVALGLMFGNAPSVHARSTELDQTVGTSTEVEVAGFGEGVTEAQGEGQIEDQSDAAGEADVVPGAVNCCANILLTPSERAARARVLEQVLTPHGSPFDRVRLGLFLQLEAHLTENEEREIS